MGNLQFNLEKYKEKPKNKLAYWEWQDRAAKVIEILQVPKEAKKIVSGKVTIVKPRSMFFKWFKTQRSKAESAFSVTTSKERNTPWLYFCWLMTH